MDISPKVKWPGRQVDNSPPTAAVVKNAWSFTSTPPYVRKQSVQFIFTPQFCFELDGKYSE
jgi:hypothetical protein